MDWSQGLKKCSFHFTIFVFFSISKLRFKLLIISLFSTLNNTCWPDQHLTSYIGLTSCNSYFNHTPTPVEGLHMKELLFTERYDICQYSKAPIDLFTYFSMFVKFKLWRVNRRVGDVPLPSSSLLVIQPQLTWRKKIFGMT